MSLRDIVDGIVAVAWAPQCVVCAAPLVAPTRGIVCSACWHRTELTRPPVCDWCGEPCSGRVHGEDGRSGPRCTACQRTGDGTRRRAAGRYAGVLRLLVHAFKYEGRRSLAHPLGALMSHAGGDILAHADYVVPVPLYPTRRWTRGFNQAEALADQLGRPVVDVLCRRRATVSQTELTSAQRWRSVRTAFGLRTRRNVTGHRVVLIDDVWTTGATIEACASVLRQAGARDVSALTVATTRVRLPRQSRRPPHPPDALRRHGAKSDPAPDASSSP